MIDTRRFKAITCIRSHSLWKIYRLKTHSHETKSPAPIPSSHESVQSSFYFKRIYLSLRMHLVESIESSTTHTDKTDLITFSLPSIIVTKLYKTWKTAKKNMRMCNSCNPSVDISGSCPCRENPVSLCFNSYYDQKHIIKFLPKWPNKWLGRLIQTRKQEKSPYSSNLKCDSKM